MSLNPVPYFQTWEQNLVAAHHRYRGLYGEYDSNEEEDDDAYHDLPESPSSSDSFLSRFSQSSLGRRLNFYPYAGAGVTVEDDIPSIQGITYESDGQLDISEHGGETSWSDTTAAYDVCRGKRIAQVFIAAISGFLSTGIIIGFAAIKPVLVSEGVYRCPNRTPGSVCFSQELRLNLLFAVASAASYIFTIPGGAILRRYGPRVDSIIGSFAIAIGAFLIAFGSSLPFDGYIPGFLLLSLGGPLIYVSSFHLANAFPAHSTAILSALTGAFDSSNALFLLMLVINEKSDGGFSTRQFFLVYLTVPVFIFITQASIMPRTLYKDSAELVLQAEMYAAVDGIEQHTQRNDPAHHQTTIRKTQILLGDNSEGFVKTKHSLFDSSPAQFGMGTPIPPTNPQRLKSQGASQLSSSTIALFTILQVVKLNYFIASIGHQYEPISRRQIRKITEVFAILLPIGGLLSSLYARPVMQITHPKFIVVLVVVCATIIGVIGCIPTLPARYIHVVGYVLYRPLFHVAIQHYVARTYMSGSGIGSYLAIPLAGIGNLVIPGLDAITFRISGGNPITVNAILTALSLVAGIFMVVSFWRDCAAPIGESGAISRTDISSADDRGIDPERAPLLGPSAHQGVTDA